MPGFLLIYEDADRESGNKQNKSFTWIGGLSANTSGVLSANTSGGLSANPLYDTTNTNEGNMSSGLTNNHRHQKRNETYLFRKHKNYILKSKKCQPDKYKYNIKTARYKYNRW